jgi:hypothetical protein
MHRILADAQLPLLAQYTEYTECMAGPYTSRTDQIPATFLGGSWIGTGDQTEWTLNAHNASFGVAGSVTSWSTYPPMLAFHPSPLCPVVTFQIASGSSYTPSSLSSSEGITPFKWVADSTAANQGNDTASGPTSIVQAAPAPGPWKQI